MNHATLTTGASPALADRLPVAGLLALAMTGFICIVTETLPAGLLPQISAGLDISAALAGQMVTAYALGSLLGSLVGWRAAFWIISALTLILIAWVLAKVPDYPGQSVHERLPLRRVFTTPGVRPVLAVVIAWMLAHNILYTYIAPFVAPAGLTGRIDLVLLVFGAAAMAGIWITGKLVERHLRATVLGVASHLPAVIYVGMAVWGLSFGGAATLLQTALADTAGSGADVALSMNVVAWNGAIAAAGVVGGALLEAWGAGAFPWAMASLLVLAFAIAWSARKHGFRPGRRSGGAPVAGH